VRFGETENRKDFHSPNAAQQTKDQIRFACANHPIETLPVNNYRPAAVMILLVESIPDECFHVVYTRRTKNLRHHRGDISFPGGTRDPEDSSYLECAYREVEEELGMNRKSIEVLGTLSQHYTVTDFLVQPFIGCVSHPFKPVVNKDEIEYYFLVPLDHLLDKNYSKRTRISYRGTYHYNYDFYYEHERIWGVTGRITYQFLSTVFEFDLDHD
jgi:8-oxo-dGTP pyrophosphatase MutT (NUDIX family)